MNKLQARDILEELTERIRKTNRERVFREGYEAGYDAGFEACLEQEVMDE